LLLIRTSTLLITNSSSIRPSGTKDYNEMSHFQSFPPL